jgi:hypothetical protein
MRSRTKTATVFLAVTICLIIPAGVWAQSVSGNISGNVLDPQNKPIPGAAVIATEQNRKFTVNATTDQAGRFVFAQVSPGAYTVTIEVQGFKKFEKQGIALSANDRLALGDIVMQIGAINESVQVTAEGAQLKAESAERSEALVSKQVENIAVNGRNPLALAGLVSGVVSIGDYKTAGTQGIGNISANGIGGNSNRLTVNGISNQDTGSNSTQLTTISIDSVEEFKVLSGVYQAEYGRSAGAQINVVTKSGTAQFHATGYWAYRHDSLNANNWYNNREGLPVPILRQNDPGYTVGGPVYIPRLFNTRKDKLFFFWSQEYQRQTIPNPPYNVTVPTADQRSGDFSRTVDQNGNPWPYIKDPLATQPCSATNKAGCFQDGGVLGKIPTNRLFGPGMAFLKYLPMPNVSGVAGYNFTSQASDSRPRREDLIRIDYNATQKLRLYGNLINNLNNSIGPYNGSIRLYNQVPMTPIKQENPGYLWMVGGTYIINATTTNEFTFGSSHNAYNIYATTDAYTRTKSGVSLPLLFPDAVLGDYLPSIQYTGGRIPALQTTGGSCSSCIFDTGIAPNGNADTAWDLNDNFSKMLGAHALKAGFAWNRDRKGDYGGNNYQNGLYNFSESSSNPYDTQYGLSNVALGVFNQFQQAPKKWIPWRIYNNAEWYVQDTWKVNRRLTLDYGMRMAWYQPPYTMEEYPGSMFEPSTYNSAKAPRLYQPVKNAAGARIASDPVTGQTLPASYIGMVVPGTMDPMNGIMVGEQNGVSKYIVKSRGIQWGPRLGIAWDVTGKQNIVIRTGAGIYYDRSRGTNGAGGRTNPPTPQLITFNSGLASQIGSSSLVAAVSPLALAGTELDPKVPTTYSYTFGIQYKLPFQLVLDTSYVGTNSRHLPGSAPLNPVPYGAAFQPKNQDPTLAANLNGSSALSINFLRANYPGLGAVNQTRNGLTSNYNSLQVSVNRRYSSGLFLGVNYTFGKALGTSNPFGANNPYRPDNLSRAANYSYLPIDRRHNFSANFVYTLPNPFKQSGFLRAAGSGWQLSGVARFMSGAPYAVSYSIPGTTTYMITGNDLAARVYITGDPFAGTSGSPYKRLNGSAFAPPKPGSIGMESAAYTFFGLGVNNWDMSLEKTVMIQEKFRIRVRVDAFNIFNHTQYGDFSCTPGATCSTNGGLNNVINFRSLSDPTPTNLPYDSNGNLIWANRNGFGTVKGARDPRILQLIVRLQF